MKILKKIKLYIAKKRIPNNTIYCHNNNMKPCPYWKYLKYKDIEGNNLCYCKYLKVASRMYDLDLLWDMCKLCDINYGIYGDDEDE